MRLEAVLGLPERSSPSPGPSAAADWVLGFEALRLGYQLASCLVGTAEARCCCAGSFEHPASRAFLAAIDSETQRDHWGLTGH